MNLDNWKEWPDPCEHATADTVVQALINAIRGRGSAALRRFTVKISEDQIPWSSIRSMFILGNSNHQESSNINQSGVLPGAYLNLSSNFLILVYPRESDIQSYLDGCGTYLYQLYLFNTSLSRLDLSSLVDLEVLHLHFNYYLTVIDGLSRLTQLTELTLFQCSRLKQLPPLDRLSKLIHLDLSGCYNLRELPDDICSLKSLRWLDLSYLRLQDLPDWLPEISEAFSMTPNWSRGKNKALVSLEGTRVNAISDMSIFHQPYEVVAKWFEERKLGRTKTLNEIKVVFLGDGEAGKSHTIARLMNDGGDPVDYIDQSTPGIVIKHKPYTLDGRDFQVHYWDFGGQEIMHSMHRIFLTNRTMYVVLLNARDDTQSDRAHYWLQNIRSFAPDAPVLLVLNKIDQNPKASVDERTLRARYPGLTQVVRLSALNFDKECFNKEFTDILLKEIAKTGCLDAQWPISWIKVKEQLENMESHFILGDEYKKICREYHLDEVELSMLKWFNDLGVSFCFCDEEDYELEDHVILRPDWITNGLYILLFNHLENSQNGQIPHKSIHKLLKSAHGNPEIHCTLPQAKYSNSDIQYVLGVMRKFLLSFTDGNHNEFIPMLCKQDSGVDIRNFENDFNILEFNMEFEYLPENLLHRLMVERHEELDMANTWRRGAQFRTKDLGYSAVVLIDVNNTLRFFIRHTDPMHRPNTYLTMLKSNVDRIVEKMGLKAPACKLVYKLDGRQDVFDYEMLKVMLEAGQTHAFSMTWRRMLPIQDILNQSAPDGLQNEMLLLNAIQEACGRIQDELVYRLIRKENGTGYTNGKGMEDLRNRRVRDDLLILLRERYRVCDQTQIGSSGSGKSTGELDLLIRDENNAPWTIIEALRIGDGTKAAWNDHLNKLLVNYNSRGLSLLYLLTYVDADSQSFVQICSEYQTYIPKHAAGQYICADNSFTELNCSNSQSFKAFKCQYTCGGDPVTVYHIFVRIDTRNE